MARANVPRRAAREQRERGAEALAAAFAGVSDVAFDGGIKFARLLPDSLFDTVKMGVDEVESALDLLCGNGRFSLKFREGFHTLHNRKTALKVNQPRAKRGKKSSPENSVEKIAAACVF
jgi:hypothetical protein